MLKAAHAVVLQLINQRLVRYITHIYPTIFKHSFQSNYEIIQSDRSMTHPAKQNMRLCLNFFEGPRAQQPQLPLELHAGN